MDIAEFYTVFGHIRFKDDGTKEVYGMDRWKEDSKKRTQEQIDSFFKKETNPAIGILTGKINGITVIDFDTKDNELMMILYDIAPTLVVMSRKGFHMYYRYIDDPMFAQGTTRFQGGVDVRNDGGIIFAPPTPNYEITNDLEIAELTTEAIEAIRPFAITHKKVSDLKNTTTRNDDLFRMACAWINEYPKEEVFKRMVTANKEFAKGELSIKELEAIYQQASKYDPVKKAAQEIEKKVGEMVEMKKIDTSTIEIRGIDQKKRFTWGTRLLDTNVAIIKENNFIVIGAKRGSGKTTFAYDMAIKNARDMGHRVLFISLEMEEKELHDDFGRKYAGITIQEEFDMQIPHHKRESYDQRIEEIKSIKNLVFAGVRRAEGVSWKMIEEIIKQNPCDMIFLDNLDLIAGEPKESDLDRQKRITASIMNFTSKNRIPLALIHHYRKSGKVDMGMDELGGSGKIADNADRVIRVKKNYDPDAVYPVKYQTEIYLQKGRGYPEHVAQVFFIKGTFVDVPPLEITPQVKYALDMFEGRLSDD